MPNSADAPPLPPCPRCLSARVGVLTLTSERSPNWSFHCLACGLQWEQPKLPTPVRSDG